MFVRLLFALLTAALIALPLTPTQAQPDLPLDQITLPPGFAIDVYATGVPNARSMALGDQGTLFVGSRRAQQVYAITDTDGDMHADTVRSLDFDFYVPNGLAFVDGALYVAEISRILRFDDIENRLDEPLDAVVIRDDLPSDEHHGWKYLRLGPDGYLYVPQGVPCNVCEVDPQVYGTINRMALDGSTWEVYATGVRNSVGFDFDPATGDLWFTDNGRDWISDDLPPDELNHAPQPGLHFGFPYCHGGFLIDVDFGSEGDCENYTAPAQNLGPHVAALGMRFYTGDHFPAPYHGQIFIAEHGSWNRTVPIGYRVTLVRLEDGQPVSYEPFAEGWLAEDGSVWGRPVDVLEMPDGSLLVSDDMGGVIYRIDYVGEG